MATTRSSTAALQTRFDHTSHLPPSTYDGRHHGHQLNRLLVTATIGTSKLSSYNLPHGDYTYGAPSVAEASRPDSVAGLMTHRFSRSSKYESPLPDHISSAPSTHALQATNVVFGAPTAKPDDIEKIFMHQYTSKLHSSGDDPAYNPFALGRRGTGNGGAPPPRPNLTSSLRESLSQHRLDNEAHHPAARPRHRPRVTDRPVTAPSAHEWAAYSGPIAKGLTLATSRMDTHHENARRTGSSWKLAKFKEVPSRVPVDGKPMRHETRPVTSSIHHHC